MTKYSEVYFQDSGILGYEETNNWTKGAQNEIG